MTKTDKSPKSNPPKKKTIKSIKKITRPKKKIVPPSGVLKDGSIRRSNNKVIFSKPGKVHLIWQRASESSSFSLTSFPIYDYAFTKETQDKFFKGRITRGEIVETVKGRLSEMCSCYQLLTKDNYPNLIKGILILLVGLIIAVGIQVASIWLKIHPYAVHGGYILFLFFLAAGVYYLHAFQEDV